MMYFKLVKVFFKENYSLKRLLGTNAKQSKLKTILLSLLILYGLGSIFFSLGFLFFHLGDIFKQMNSLDSLLTYIFMYATFLSAFFVIIRASSYLFHYKDYDFLASLPIKNEIVVAAKTTVLMVMIYLSVFIFTAPIIFSYLYHGGFSVYRLIIILLSLLLIPIVPLIVFSFISLLFTYILTRLGVKKIFGLVMTFALLLGFMYFSFSFNANSDNPFINQEAFLDSVSQYLPHVKLFFSAVVDKNFFSFILFVVINLGLLIGYFYAVKDLTHKTNQNKTKSFRRKSNRKINHKQRSVTWAIIRKEFKKFFSVNIYALNSGFGIVLMIAGGILALVYKSNLQAMMVQLTGINAPVELIILIIFGFLISTIYTSAISLSLEGKNFWLMKSLPISAKKVMLSKMYFNVLLAVPVSIITLFSIAFALESEFLMVLIMLIVIVSFSLATSIFGSIINLHFPKFEYKNETEVVKQSIGAFLGMFTGWILIVILGVGYYLLSDILSSEIIMLMMALLNLLIFGLGYIYIDRKAESLFMNFS
jgi:ABC-2 type transport system permease protein